MDVLSKVKSSGDRGGATHSLPPTKEDILNTLDSFAVSKATENNNNTEPVNHCPVIPNSNTTDTMASAQWDTQETDLPTPASLSHSYSLEWEKLFSRPDMMRYLKSRAVDGDLRSSRFRSVVWKLFLEVLPPNKEQWITKTRASRAKFEELKNRLIVNPRKAVDSVDITLNNPLSQDEESPWNKFFQDNELRLTIKQDVIRTYPRIEFFQSNQLRNLMVNILFVFAKENVELSYRQGMHELLAPLIFVLHCDHQAFQHACEIESILPEDSDTEDDEDMEDEETKIIYSTRETRNVMKEVMDPAFLEHDAYTMFCQVMETVEPWYLSRDMFCNSKTGSMRNLELLHATPFAKSQDLNPSNAIVTKLTRIQDYILKKFDPELHQHLERLEIAPQIYGIRWLRLLFGREFPMQDLLMLWDAIFGDGIGFDLVDYIFVAMLMYIRDILLTNDYATCLTILMKFPPVADVHYFVVKATWLREPNQYPRPPNYTHQGPIKASHSMGGSSDGLSPIGNSAAANSAAAGNKTSRQVGPHSRQTKRQGSMAGGFSSFSRKFSRPRTLNVPKSSSEPMNLQTDISPDVRDNDPIGSTVSLSQVEDNMFRNAPSASSLARLDMGSNLRSAQSSPGVHQGGSVFPITPDDVSLSGSPTKVKPRSKPKKLTKLERDLQAEVARLQSELHDKENMCRYCSSKLEVHIGRLQQDLSNPDKQIDREVMVSLAELKLVRDILSGTLRFTQNISEDQDMPILDGYYSSDQAANDDSVSDTNHELRKGISADMTSPDSDIIVDDFTNSSRAKEGLRRPSSGEKESKLFYMSSEDTTSPEDGVAPFTGADGDSYPASSNHVGGNRSKTVSEAEKSSSVGGSDGTGGPSKIKSIFNIKKTVDSQGSANNNNSKHHHAYHHPEHNQVPASHPLSSDKWTAVLPPSSFSTYETARTVNSSKGSAGSRQEGKQREGGYEVRELSSIDCKTQRGRAHSDITGSSSYWPDFLSSNIRFPWTSSKRENEFRRDNSRERSHSQPEPRSMQSVVPSEGAEAGKYDVNPLYKMKYQDTMEQ